MATVREHWYLLRVGYDEQPLLSEITTNDGDRLAISASKPYCDTEQWNAFRIDLFVERDVETDERQNEVLRKMFEPRVSGLSFGKLNAEEKTLMAPFGSEHTLAGPVTSFCDCLAWTIGHQMRLAFNEATITVDGEPKMRAWWVEAPFRLRPNALIGGSIREMTSSYPVDRKVTESDLSTAVELFSKGLADPVQLFLEVDAMKGEMRKSAVVMLCTCAEWAVKQRITKEHPDTAWLLQELQSPPIGKMLRRFDLLGALVGARISEQDVKQIEAAFDARNSIVHGKKVVPMGNKKADLDAQVSKAFNGWQAAIKKLLVALYQ